MKTHYLKTLPAYFDAVHRGDKTFEIRSNDRDFQTGDTLVLQEYHPQRDETRGAPPRPAGSKPLTRQELGYSGREVTVTTTYILHGGKFGLAVDTVVMGFVSPTEALMATSISEIISEESLVKAIEKTQVSRNAK